MEKITKKKKAKKGLKKRIGLFAIGGLSLVLTICLSVGATLAWFAGSTHADKSLFMGGPVYVEMTGRDGSSANWQGGSGKLDIEAFERGVGTLTSTGGIIEDNSDILLPGQGFAIYSQARVFSTSATTSVGNKTTTNTSSGADVTNTSTNGANHVSAQGRKTSTTSSVLRARFSINVEFDPTVGFNNFTGPDYAKNYPVQTGQYKGNNAGADGADVNINAAEYAGLLWSDALNKPAYVYDYDEDKYPANARRDGVTDATFTSVTSGADLTAIKAGTKKSIYSWKFVSKEVYNAAYTAAASDVSKVVSASEGTAPEGIATTYKYVQMGAPFDGTDTGSNVQGYYGVWILTSNGATTPKNVMKESDSFYKARCNNYIQTYVEQYPNEYGDITERKIGNSLKALEKALNDSFVNLVNDSSNAIIAGYLNGMTVNPATGIMTYNTALTSGWPAEAGKYASWLYIDPTIGNDTNTNELSTGTGGWWYLVECDNGKVGGTQNVGGVVTSTDMNEVYTAVDNITGSDEPDALGNIIKTNTIGSKKSGETDVHIKRTVDLPTSDSRLDAKLYEIKPSTIARNIGTNGTDDGKNKLDKVVSYSFPFVNGRSVLEGDALTNVFANAKITVQISFQAIQAFFPFSTNIDNNMTYKNTLLGTEKALSIRNAIPIYNEAFDYYESYSASSISGL